MSPPSERGLPNLVPAKHAGQRWTRIDAQHLENNDGLEGEVLKLGVEVGVDRSYFEGVIGYEGLDMVRFCVGGTGVLGVTCGSLDALTCSRHT